MSEKLLMVLLESLNRLLILTGVTSAISQAAAQTTQQVNMLTLKQTQTSAHPPASLDTYYLKEATIEW